MKKLTLQDQIIRCNKFIRQYKARIDELKNDIEHFKQLQEQEQKNDY